MEEVQTCDKIYTAILTATYHDKQNTVDVEIQYEETLPRRPPLGRTHGFYPITKLVDRLEDSNRDTAITTYSIHEQAINEAIRAVLDDSDTETASWMTWLENEGYEKFVHNLGETTKREGETYLLASQDELSEATIREEAQPYLFNLLEKRRANLNRWRSF